MSKLRARESIDRLSREGCPLSGYRRSLRLHPVSCGAGRADAKSRMRHRHRKSAAGNKPLALPRLLGMYKLPPGAKHRLLV
ncbi:hypothetical protein CA264_13020 [Pontibacter actiniarum]|uniref:Uncharacterized protein n=1 Tax=Pontibacter actiniarum TaxID=323450 RepID=A0A1X9YTW1_9BACT|nr:hypothetical protein CA264_13020 [Pontibacter actiniarum]